MAFDYVRPDRLVSDNILTYKVEEVAEGAGGAVVAWVGVNDSEFEWGGTSVLASSVFGGSTGVVFDGFFSVARRSRQWPVLSAWYPQNGKNPVLSTSGMMRQRFLARDIFLVSRGRPRFLGWLHQAVRSRVGRWDPLRRKILPT